MSRKEIMSAPYGWCWPISTETGLTLNWLKGGRIGINVTLRHTSELPDFSWALREASTLQRELTLVLPSENGSLCKVPWPHCVDVHGSQMPRTTKTLLHRCPDPKTEVKIMRINNNISCYSSVTVSLLRKYVLWIVFSPRRWTWSDSSTQFHLALMRNKCKYYFH